MGMRADGEGVRAVQRGIAVIPKSVNLKRIEDNAKLVELSEQELAEIAELPKDGGFTRFVAPPWPVNLECEEANPTEAFASLA